MAIVIVEKGKIKAEEKWAGKCSACGSKAECLRSDLKHITYNSIDGQEHSWAPCPVCGVGGNGYGGLLMYPVK